MRRAIILTLTFCAELARAGAWTEPPGSLWLKFAGTIQRSGDFFARDGAILPDGRVVEPGDSRPYDENGTSYAREMWIDLEYGLTSRMAVGLQVPWKHLEYENDVETVRSWGWGDVTARARFALTTGSTRLTVRGAWKAPTGRFSSRTDRLPIGENQSDLELGLELGRSLGRPMTWANVEVGRRFRSDDDEFDVELGDEWFGAAEAGVAIDRRGRFAVKARWSFLRGDPEGVLFFAPATALSRELDRFEGTLLVDLGDAVMELGAARVLRGEGYPTAVTFSAAVSRRFALMD